jgi:hypothetical protein
MARKADHAGDYARTADGTYNDLENPRMGSVDTRFGRNVPIDRTHPHNERLMQPNPRTVSRELLTRETFLPAERLKIQFMLRDWLSHGKSPKDNPWEVPLADDDWWPEKPMRILRTKEDPTRTPEEEGTPPTHINVHSHWWNGFPIHCSQAVKDFLASGAARRVQPEQLPGYAPDLNPEEGTWKHLKCVGLKNLCCESLTELKIELRKAMERLRHKSDVILGCISSQVSKFRCLC